MEGLFSNASILTTSISIQLENWSTPGPGEIGGDAEETQMQPALEDVNATLDLPLPSLEAELGQRSENPPVVITMTIIYSIILITGIFGNVITLSVILRHPRMHAGATNWFLASLALSDLISLIFGLPMEMYQLFYSYPFPFPEFVCVARGWLTETTTTSSVLVILCFSFERYLAVAYPFAVRLQSRMSRALPLLIGAWVVAFLVASPIALQLGLVYHAFDLQDRPREGSQFCDIKRPLPYSFEAVTVATFVIPMIIIIVFHVVILIKLRSAHSTREALRGERDESGAGAVSAGAGGGATATTAGDTFSRGRKAVLRILGKSYSRNKLSRPHSRDYFLFFKNFSPYTQRGASA